MNDPRISFHVKEMPILLKAWYEECTLYMICFSFSIITHHYLDIYTSTILNTFLALNTVYTFHPSLIDTVSKPIHMISWYLHFTYSSFYSTLKYAYFSLKMQNREERYSDIEAIALKSFFSFWFVPMQHVIATMWVYTIQTICLIWQLSGNIYIFEEDQKKSFSPYYVCMFIMFSTKFLQLWVNGYRMLKSVYKYMLHTAGVTGQQRMLTLLGNWSHCWCFQWFV
jgi:hypothetical protein